MRFFDLKQRQKKNSGVTLIEILIVTVIIGLIAAVSFPVFKIIQQREKERRLKKILFDVRSAISGSKSPQTLTDFTEGFRTYLRTKGMTLIEDAHPDPADKAIKDEAISVFINNLGELGLGYPPTPDKLINTNYMVEVATSTIDPANDKVSILVDRRFLRNIPPHPFKSWYPQAKWEFKPAVKIPAVSDTIASDSADWTNGNASGVFDIVSKGAGLGLDGSNTDDW